MLTKIDIKSIIEACRGMAKIGLKNGLKATLPVMKVDFLTPPNDFLGLQDNLAIFVNQKTFNFLGKHHPTWEANKTIAVKENFLKIDVMLIIGVMVHEMGHAFNVAAGIANTEANAYVYEIEVLLMCHQVKSPILFSQTQKDLEKYFEARLEYYHKDTTGNEHLASLVKKIKDETIFPVHRSVIGQQLDGSLGRFRNKGISQRCLCLPTFFKKESQLSLASAYEEAPSLTK